jgi:hypothetical protein
MRLLIAGLTVAMVTAIGSFLVFRPRPAPAAAWPLASPPASAPGITRPAHGGCALAPSSCGFPDATNTGVPAGMTLRAVPGQLSGGPGWHSAPDGSVQVTGDGTVLSGLSISGNLDISASNVTVSDVRVVTGGAFAVSMRHTTGVIIENSVISGLNGAAGRVGVAVDDVYGDSTGMVIANDDISNFKTGVQVSTGLVTGNYIHGFGYVAGDHTNGIFDAGTTQPLMIYHNTILNSHGQTDAISLDATAAGSSVANKTVEDNLLAGGGYTIYGGASRHNRISGILIEDNRFSQAFYANGGQYGPVAYLGHGAGGVWSGNTWDTTGQTIPAP